MNYAILLAGGSGTRTDENKPKQYIWAGGHMMITYALKPLAESKNIDYIYIAAQHEWQESILDDAKSAGLDTEKVRGFAIPGMNRQQSILNGMMKILSDIDKEMNIALVDDTDTVLIHDAARPFLTKELLEACYEAFTGYDGVLPVLPMKDTVYMSNNGRSVEGLLDRNILYAGQAPELFSFGIYYRANMALMPEQILKINGASEPAAMAGMNIAMIPGDESNYKVTTKEDLKVYIKKVEGR